MRTSFLAVGTILTGVLAAPLVLSGCSDPVGPSPSKAEPVVIGVSMGSSGALASITEKLRLAIRLAERQINASGGIQGGRSVSFDIIDDTSSDDVSDGSGVLKRGFDGLFQRGAIGVIGPVGSSQVGALGPIFETKQRLVISPSASAAELTASGSFGGYFFRTTPSDLRQVKVLVNILKNGPTMNFGGGVDTCKKLGIFYTDNAYARGLKTGLESAWLAQAGTTVVAVNPPPKDAASTNFETAIAQLKAGGVNCLAVLSYQPAASSFLRALATLEPATFNGLNLRVGAEALYSQDFIDAANQGIGSSSVPASLFVGAAPVPDRTRDSYLAWSSVLSAQDAQMAAANASDFYFTSTYDAAMLMALAAHQADFSKLALRDALVAVSKAGQAYSPRQFPDAVRAISEGIDIDYDGASGTCDFDANGDVSAGFQVWQVEGNKLKYRRSIAARELQ